ncbi:MAG: HD domain-containing phosphohydrolase [Anaerolineae bacterium]|nr:HD domain-containing phosphohydrolase [Anaerolineae bacterium]
MAEPSADIQILQDEFQEVHDAILNVMDQLSGAGNPIASITVQDISAIKNSLQILEARVSGKIQTGKRQLKALVGIGHVINSSLGLSKVLDEVMDTVIDLMRAERGFLMLRDHEGELTIEAARAIDQIDLKWDNFSLSKTIVHQVAETSEPVLTTNAQEDPRFESQKSVLEHNLRSVLCVPLKSKDEVIGVIFVDSRVKTGLFKADDLEMLSAFANQATVAIENARLFDSLQGANKELKDAYINTLKGWALALEMRDRETEGHTTRVTALTLKLAKKIGVKENDLEHIEQGALLHDIGKFAITDNILLKRGDLTSAERKIMEYHPKYAKEMLEKIDFLLPAIDIPYHHHEKWDGSGYPQGLMGEEIPFSARIFAIVDVWDALTSDRPYRKPMQPKEVRRIIREKSGSHFDPKVVDSFLEIDNLPIPPRPKDSQII